MKKKFNRIYLCIGLLVVALFVFSAPASADIIIDNGDDGTSSSGTWSVSGGANPYGASSLYARPDSTYTWAFDSQPEGEYEVLMWWTEVSTRGDNTEVIITHASGSDTVFIDQTENGGQWISIGTYDFGTSGSVTITASGDLTPDGSRIVSTSADAVWFRSTYVNPYEVIIDNGDSDVTSSTGTWQTSSGDDPYGTSSLYARPDATYTWDLDSSYSAGFYDVYMWWTETTTRGDNVPVDVNGVGTVYINQQSDGGQWNYLGNYYFDSGMVTEPG